MKQRVIAVVEDMFFAAKIRGTAEALEVEIKFARNLEKAIELAREERPAIIIADLHAQTCDPFQLARRLKADEELRTIPLLGFFSHVQVALKEQAELAGFDRIVPRSFFASHLPEILQGSV